ncbi:MAG: hypothetical protein JXQ72_11915 [Anaerolineae bacterium]|nr:hypothetical protein [Anaerolineae bacterium]
MQQSPGGVEMITTMNTPKLNTYQDLDLREWIALGQRNDRIREARTVALAFHMDEREALAWIADIVDGRVSEADALVFMARAVRDGWSAPV